MAKQPIKQKVATLDELPSFETATLDELPSFGEPVKKKDQTQGMVSVGSSKTTKPSLVSQSQIVTGPSASFGQLGNKILTDQKKPLPSKEDEEEIGAIDDLWNTVKGAGAKALATLSSIPQFAQTTALDVFMSATGMKSDFNKLPSADKKQIRDALSGMSTASARASGTATQAIPVGANLSQKSYDFLNKKSEEIYKKTRQEQVDVIDELAKFKQNPNAESIEKILYQGLKTTVESAPYMLIGAVSLPLMGLASAAGKRQEDLTQTGGELGLGYALNAGITGTAEAIFEGTTQKILGKAIKSAIGNPVAAKAVAQGFVKSILKDFGQEGLSEGATTLVQEISDKITKGEEIKFFPLAKKVANSTVLGSISGGGISATGAGIGAARRYIAGRVMPKDQIEKIDNNIKTIQSLNLEHGDDVDPRVNQIVNKKIDELVAENEAIITENEKIAANLSADQVKQIFDIDDKLEENFNSAKSIIDDVAMDDKAKKLLLDDLLKQQNNLKQERDAVQKQTTSEVPVQPEAAVSGEVAQGEPQAKPQGVTEEVKVEEVTAEAPKAESVEGQMQSVFGLNKTQSKAAATVIDRIAGTMAGRAGTTKEEILKTISFEKGTPTEEVTIEKPVEQVKTKTPKTEGPIDTEVKFEDAIDNQVIAWNKFPDQKKGKEIASRNQTLTKAANDLLNGNISNEDYRAIVEKESPIKPIETFFNPSTGEEIQASLEAPKVPLVNSVTAKGETFVDPKTNQEFEIVSDKVGLRLDLPAYLNNNKWVVTVHADAKDTNTGKVTKDKPVSYTGVAKIKDVTFDFNPNLAAKIAKGESSRETKFKMRGTLIPVEGANVDEQNANAKKEVESIQNDPAWVQIGANPFRHSYFYNRSTGKPVLSADEVIQIGGLVYAKNPVEANWNDEKFQVTQKGKPVLDKKGNQVYFQDNKATVSLANDGRFIVTALTDPNISTPLHEMAHIYEHYLENKEKQKILKWAGKKDWDMSVSEKFARGFEKYLSQGKTPSAELNKIFENFKKWLLDIYKGITGSKIDIQLNKDMRKIYDIMLSGEGKQVKTPSIDKVLGKPAPKKVTVNEMTALKDQIKLEAKAAKGAEKSTDQIRKSTIEKIKSMITRGALSKAQQKSLLNSLAKTNILNPVMRERLFERMDKMFKRADYQDRIKEATTFRNKIKKLAKSDTLQASVAKMAKDFGKVIPEFTDIDTYLDNARQVYDAIRKPIRKAASIEAVSAFTTDELAKQEEKVKNTLLDQYDYLAEAGLINDSMSLAEIQQYVMDVESGTKPDTTINESKVRKNLNELFDSMTDITDSIIKDGYNPLTGEEVELDKYEEDLIENFSSMDLDLMSVRDAYRSIEALENYLTNGIIDNMQTMYQTYNGANQAKNISDKGIVAQSFRRVFGGEFTNSLSRMWSSSFSPIKSILDLVHRSRTIGSDIFKASGLKGMSIGSSKAKKIKDKLVNAYNDKFKNTKPNKRDFYDITNVFQRQVYAYLKRSSNGNEQQRQKEFNDRKSIIEQTINNDLNSGNKKLQKKAKVAESVYDKIKNVSNVNELENLIDPINKQAVNWWISVYSDIYPSVKQVASSVYNLILEDDINYTPDIFEQTVGEEKKTASDETPYKMEFSYLNQKPSGTLMKNNRISILPDNRSLSFDFDYNNAIALGKMLADIETASSFQQYRGFVESPSFKKIYPDATDRSIIKDRMNYYANEVRSKNIAGGTIDQKKWAKIIQAISRYGTARSLGSATAGLKQASTAIVNTAVNLINDPDATRKGLRLVRDADAMNFLDNSGYDISNRGLESQTAIESANRIIEKANVDSVDSMIEALDKSNKIYVENSLKTGDIYGARASWMAYYIHKLNTLGYNTDDIDWKTHKLVKEAGDYAEDQINLQQNPSDTAMMGKFLNSKHPWTTIARSTILPFSSFIFNAKDRITTDVTILTSKNSSKQDKLDALKSLSATTAEMLAYEAASATISSFITIAAYSMLGQEEDPEEREKRIKKYANSGIKGFITDALSPIPNIGDIAIIAFINKILDITQQNMDEEDKFLLFEYKPESESDGMLNIIGGIPYAAAKPFINIGDTIYKISSDSYKDDYGNEIYLSNEEKEKMGLILAAEFVGATGILPSEVVRLVEKVKQQIEKEAR